MTDLQTYGHPALQALNVMFSKEQAVTLLDLLSATDGANVVALRNALADPTSGAGMVGFRQSGVGAVSRSLLEKAREVAVSFEDFGAVGNGTSDDSLAIQRAISEVSARGGGVVHTAAREYHIGTTGITVPPTVQLQMHPDAALIYTGAGDALTLDCTSTLVTTQVCHRVCVRKPNPDWHSSRGASDATSRGVIFKNAGCAELHVSVRNFHQNLVLLGDGQGNAGNHIFLGDIRNGKSNILFTSTGSGYVNQNTFYGGRVRHDGSFGGPGTVGLDMETDGNGCTFIGILLEGGSVERVAVVSEAYNTWVNCRFEANPAGSFVFLPGSGRNTVVGGYNPRGLALFDQQGNKHNLILTEHGSQVHSGGTAGPGPAMRMHASLANNGWEVVNEDGSGAVHAEMSKAGRMNVYREGGKTGAFSFPTAAISGPDRAVMVGFGNAAPMTALRGYNDTTIDMPGLYRISSARWIMPTYIDNADAVGGGAPVGSLYKTSTGEVRIVV